LKSLHDSELPPDLRVSGRACAVHRVLKVWFQFQAQIAVCAGFRIFMAQPQLSVSRDAHPIDLIERVAHANDWTFQRAGEDEVAIGITGQWTEYDIAFSWLADHEALHLSCAWEVTALDSRFNELIRLLALINERLLMGHFDYWRNEGVVMFRQSLILTGGLEPTDKQIEALLTSATKTCETYYQAFQYIIWSGIPAGMALENVMFETQGSA
jgi:hypothetical protein